MKLVPRWVSWAFFPVCLIAPPLLALYGALSPWSVSETAFANQSDQKKLLVGISYRGGSTQDGSYERRARTYAYVPEGFRTFETVSVIQENGKVNTEIQRFGLAVPLLAFSLGIFGSLWQLYRFISSRRRVASER